MIKTAHRSILLLWILLLVPPGAAAAAERETQNAQPLVLAIKGGKVRGVASEIAPGVRAFKGIPFATPPTGNLRWRPPQPAPAWTGVYDAGEYRPRCVQGSRSQDDAPAMNEDCLYLNVWAPEVITEPLPVMVWIHGGALVGGSGSRYDGANLAHRGVVVVTLNYRLGIFGYLAHPLLSAESERGVSGNYGVLDQLRALHWVKENIGAFGGDPGNVTIFGESAGSWSVQVLVASPLAAGLFHRAIGESGGVAGSYGATPSLEQVEIAGARYEDALFGGRPVSLAEMRAATPAELMKQVPFDARPRIRPAIDGWVLPKSVSDILAAGEQNHVPVLVGSNADEGSLAVRAVPKDAAAYRGWAKDTYGDLADDFLKLYPADETGYRDHFLAAYADGNFAWEMRNWARAASRAGSAAFLYRFSRVPPGSPTGVYHGAEIPYVFGNIDAPGARYPYADPDRKLSQVMASAWVQFAKKGNPNGEDQPLWLPFTAKEEVLIDFGDTIAVRRDFHKARLDFFDRYYAARSGD